MNLTRLALFVLSCRQNGVPYQVSRDSQGCTLAFRGSSSLYDFVADLKSTQVQCNKDGLVSAFTEAHDRLRTQYRASLHSMKCLANETVITGHSIGGAIGSIAGIEMKLPVVAFASPKVACSRHVICPALIRGNCEGDPIPSLPRPRNGKIPRHLSSLVFVPPLKTPFHQRLRMPDPWKYSDVFSAINKHYLEYYINHIKQMET